MNIGRGGRRGELKKGREDWEKRGRELKKRGKEEERTEDRRV